MSHARNGRRVVALLAAYVVALAAVLLPLSVAAGSRLSSALCVTLADGSHAPAQHDGGCPCAAGCGMQCCGQALLAPPPVATALALAVGLALGPAPALEPTLPPAGRGRHEPRAPPAA